MCCRIFQAAMERQQRCLVADGVERLVIRDDGKDFHVKENGKKGRDEMRLARFFVTPAGVDFISFCRGIAFLFHARFKSHLFLLSVQYTNFLGTYGRYTPVQYLVRYRYLMIRPFFSSARYSILYSTTKLARIGRSGQTEFCVARRRGWVCWQISSATLFIHFLTQTEVGVTIVTSSHV